MAEKLKFEIYANQNLGGSWTPLLQKHTFRRTSEEVSETNALCSNEHNQLKQTRSAQTNALHSTYCRHRVTGGKWRCEEVRLESSTCAVVLSCQIDWRK